MTYDKFIQNIIKTRGQWCNEVRYSERGCERHHIVPKCLGGEPKYLYWKKHQNVIWLYPEEHYIAHKLLLKKYPKNSSLIYAFYKMSRTKNNRYLATAADYQLAKKLYKKYYVRVLSEETKAKIGAKNKGHIMSIEQRQAISKAHKNKPSWNKGKKMNEESRLKLSQTRKQKNLGANKVRCIELDIIFDSMKEACKILGINYSSLTKCLQGILKTAGKYHWEYIEKYKKR